MTSLYPWVNKYSLYPTGHPTVITQFVDDTHLKDYFGLVKLTIRPPRGLYHPVLPFRHGGKLTFPLCRTCVETQMSVALSERCYTCPHDGEQRQLTGTWCTPEVREALRRGYTIVRLHEVWHYPSNRQKFGLFRDYVNQYVTQTLPKRSAVQTFNLSAILSNHLIKPQFVPETQLLCF